MSHNQSRGERTESAQYRKSGRSSYHRNFSGGGYKGNSGSGGGATAPPSNTNLNVNNNQPTLSSNRSFKKHHNVQGGQPRTSAQTVNPDFTAPAPRAVQNGSQPSQQHAHGAPNAPSPVVAVKPTDVVTPKASRAPRAPSSNVPSASGDSKNLPTPVTPAKAEVPQSYTLQFGSISPGFMNGMQIPARTSSAPPNLDEQKRDQARRESLRTPPDIPKQQLPKKDAGPVDQPTAVEAYRPAKPKREVQSSAAPVVSQTQKPSVHPIPGVPIQVTFHQHQVPVQFGTPNPQIQSQAMSATSFPVPMAMHIPLQIGNPSVPPQVFVPGLQPHHMQPQSILHQSPFSSQMGPQVPAQVGPHHMTPQFPQQQPGMFGGTRKAVKITHPDTHEELRLDGSASRQHSSLAPQSQPVSSFPPASTFYPGSYNANSVYFQAPSSHPLSSTLPPSQPPRYYGQVTLKPATSSHGGRDAISLVNSVPKGDSQKALKPSQTDAESSLQQPKSVEGTKSVTLPVSESGQSLMLNSIVPPSPSLVEKPLGASSIAVTLDSSENQQEKVDGQSTCVSVLPSRKPNVETTVSFSTNVVIKNPKEMGSVGTVAEPGALDLKRGSAEQENISEPSDRLDAETIGVNHAKTQVSGKNQRQVTSNEQSKIDEEALMLSASTAVTLSNQTLESAASSQEFVGSLVRQQGESTTLSMENGKDSSPPGSGNAEAVPLNEDEASSLGGFENAVIEDNVTKSSSTLNEESMATSAPSSDENVEHGSCVVEDNKALTAAVAVTKDKLEQNVTKGIASRSKKKRKELLKKLDSSGPTSDLYMAYKGPEEKKEGALSTETMDSTSSNNLDHLSSEVSRTEITKDKAGQSKVEPDDWEDAADISTPKLETSENGKQDGKSVELNSEVMTKKYSRDFLLKFAYQFTELPDGFQVVPETAEAFTTSKIGIPYDQYSPGRNIDRRLDRRPSNMGEEEKWKQVQVPLMPGRDPRDANFGPNVISYRPNQMPNPGVLRYPRMQSPVMFPGVLPGQTPGMMPQVIPRNTPDSDRWARGLNFQKGLMPSPQTPLQMKHKAERKYEIGKVTDEEEAKQRQLKGILNKLTPQNFEKLFEQVKQVNIDNATTLNGVISQIFDKALMEPTFCEMYANFCSHLAVELPELNEDNEKITFKRLLLNKCQEEFERGEREQEEANQVDVKGEAEQSAQEREEMRLRARRRMLGNIRLIGELYKKRMLTERIMHECIKKLLGQHLLTQQIPEEEDVEALCKLMSTIGEMIDHPKAKKHMDVYFDGMEKFSNNMKLSSRVRFMLKDAIDLRKNKWQQRRKVEGPKKIEEVHRDAAQERQAQTRGLARTPSLGPSVRRSQPTDFSPRGSNILASPSSQMGGYRPVPSQLRGYGGQDVQIEERHTMDGRTLSVLLPQRPLGDDAPFLGPQGGLARGMSFRGHSASPGIQLPDSGDSRKLGPGYNPVSERTAYSSREDPVQRYMPDRLVGPSAYEQSSAQERSSHYGNRDTRNPDRGLDRSVPLSPPAESMGALTPNAVSEKVPEERLRDMSMSTIKEFYSAKDENEVALCIEDLNNPSFYPSMISLWVTDSFERKDMERNLLTKLLITLTKYREGLISQDQLIKGFDSVLMTLEDAVNDAPKAAEFLGRIFARVILECVIPLGEIERIIHEGGEEQGRLVEIGLAAEVLGTTLEVIASERGDSGLKEFRSGSSLKLETFRPPGSNKSWRIDKFI